MLGHGGTVVAQVRALTGCQVHVFGGNDRGPMLAPADAEQVVQMEGSHMQCLMAVRQVGSLLRGWQVGRAFLRVVHYHCRGEQVGSLLSRAPDSFESAPVMADPCCVLWNLGLSPSSLKQLTGTNMGF